MYINFFLIYFSNLPQRFRVGALELLTFEITPCGTKEVAFIFTAARPLYLYGAVNRASEGGAMKTLQGR